MGTGVNDAAPAAAKATLYPALRLTDDLNTLSETGGLVRGTDGGGMSGTGLAGGGGAVGGKVGCNIGGKIGGKMGIGRKVGRGGGGGSWFISVLDLFNCS